MVVNSLSIFSKILFVFLLVAVPVTASTASTRTPDEVVNRTMFNNNNDTVARFLSLSEQERQTWAEQQSQNLSQASQYELLVLADYYYQKSKYKKAKIPLDILIPQLTDDSSKLLAANALFIDGLVVAIGLNEFENAISSFERSAKLLDELPSIKQNQNAVKHAVVTNYRLGSLLLFLKKPKLAEQYLLKAIDLSSMSDDDTYLVTPTLELAKFYISQKKYDQAEKKLIDAYDLALASNSDRRPDILHQLSRYYRINKRYELAIDYATRSLRYYEESGNQLSHLASAYNNLAIVYEESGDLNTALVHYLNVLKILEGKPQYHFLALATHNTGLIYQQQNKLDLALKYLQQANDLFKDMKHEYYLMSNHLSLANVNYLLKDHSSTVKYGELTLASAAKNNQSEITFEALGFLSKSYLALGQYQKAAVAFDKYSRLQSTKNEELIQSLAQKSEVIVSEDVALKASLSDAQSRLNELKLVTAQQQRNERNNIQIIYVLIAAIVVLLFLYNRSRRINRISNLSKHIDSATSLPSLTDESFLLKTVNKEFVPHSNVFALKLPLLAQLLDVMDADKAQEFRTHIIQKISQFIERPLYKLSEDTFVFAKTPPENDSIAQRFNLLLDYYQSLIPENLRTLSEQYSIMLGCLNKPQSDKAVNLIQAKNMINLSLTALSAVKQYQTWEAKNNWLMLTEKENSSTTMFTCPSRKEWLQLINNHMLTVESGLDQDIDWLNVPHYDQ